MADMSAESYARTGHRPLPESDFYVWDGSLGEKALYRAPREDYAGHVPDMEQYKIVGLKFGTSTISHKNPGDTVKVLGCIADEVRNLHERGVHVYIISSGAVDLGRRELGAYGDDLVRIQGIWGQSGRTGTDIKRLLSGIGQPRLMATYRQCFRDHGITVAQSLVTSSDLMHDRTRRELMGKYLDYMSARVVPVINEDDLRSSEELSEGEGSLFSDNDGLFARVSSYLAQENGCSGTMYAGMLTDQAGIRPVSYFRGERTGRVDDEVIRVIVDPFNLKTQMFDGEPAGQAVGRGSAASKIDAMETLAAAGIPGFVAHGGYHERDTDANYYRPIAAAMKGLCVGTRFSAKEPV